MAKKSSTLDANLACVEPSSHAKVEGVITALSPMKSARGRTDCSYYDGEITDDVSSMRFCGFNAGVRRKLEEMYDSGEAVKLDGCEVKKARHDHLEIIVKNSTEISKSARCFNATKEGKPVTCLEKLSELPQYQRVTVRAKVMHTEQICNTRSGERVQEVVIADGTGHVTLNIWGEHVGKVEEGHCYEFKGLMVKEFYGRNVYPHPRITVLLMQLMILVLLLITHNSCRYLE